MKCDAAIPEILLDDYRARVSFVASYMDEVGRHLLFWCSSVALHTVQPILAGV